MKISVCIITNNNPEVLNAIKSVYDFAYEIILVNTVDKFDIDISELHKVKLFHFDWVNDFSKARNYSLSKAKGDWIFIIDSDEVCQTEINNLNPKFDLYFCNIYNSNIPKPYESLRIFKNNIGIEFKNKMHETIESYATMQNTAMSNVEISHNGYEISAEEMDKKQTRNYKLMLKDKGNPVRNFHLANYYFVYESNYKKARSYYLKVLEDDVNAEHKAMALNNIYSCEVLLNHSEDSRLQTLMNSIKIFPYQLQARINLIDYMLTKVKENKNFLPYIEKEINKVKQIKENKLSLLHCDFNIDNNYINQKNKELQQCQ